VIQYNMDAIINQVKSLAENADEKTRKTILTGLRDAMQALETSDDTVTRLWGEVRSTRAPGTANAVVASKLGGDPHWLRSWHI
jgi:hypothetical protein